jgi:mitochondrial fission protein ELM1
MAQVRSIIENQPAIKWTISSSPRTPADTVQLLEGFASQNTNVTFFRSEDTPDGWIERAYAENYTVWVTADSVSMVYEALTAGCRVGILPVDWKKKSDKFQISISYLLEKKMVTNYQTWLAGKNEIKIGVPLNEASRSAKEILTRWWPDRLK